MDTLKIFIYQDASGVISSREVTSVSETSDYIQGYCSNAQALRTFRKDRVLEFLDDPSQASERLAYHKANCKPITRPKARQKTAKDNVQLEICFTGFKKADKTALTELAKSNNLIVRNSVTTRLNFLCCGENAGPKKIDKSREQGVVILNESQFKKLLETGEIPEC